MPGWAERRRNISWTRSWNVFPVNYVGDSSSFHLSGIIYGDEYHHAIVFIMHSIHIYLHSVFNREIREFVRDVFSSGWKISTRGTRILIIRID